MINQVTLTGRLTRDVELRYTQSGRAVGNFTIAVDRRFKGANGDREADFISCVIWGKSAENFANYVHKGNLVGLEGRIQTRNYDNNQGQKVYVTEVVVDNFSFLESRKTAGQAGGNANNFNNFNGGMGGNAPQNNGNMNQPQYGNQNPGNFGNGGNQGNGMPNNGNQNQPQMPNNAPQSSNGGNGSNQGDPFAGNGEKIDISDDDLPF